MNKVYILIKHFNNIDDDYVEIVKVSENINSLLQKFNELIKEYLVEYKIIEETNLYKRFSNENLSYLIEIFIEEIIMNEQNGG